MKKLIIILILLFLTSCSTNSNDLSSSSNNTNNESIDLTIPNKLNPEGVNVIDSSITTNNLDDYLFREDVCYVDIRYYSWIVSDGYIPGFKFVQFYDFLVSRSGNDCLFRMDGGSSNLTFTPIYNESINILGDIFPKDKKIFLVSQSGVESGYLSTLLAQYGYDIANIYNVGGVINSTGFPSYKNVGKHFVKGNGIFGEDTRGEFLNFDFEKFRIKSKLTLI